MWSFSTAHTPSCSHHCTVKLEKPPLHPKFHLSVIPSDPSVPTATDLPHTLTAKPSGAPFNPDASVIPRKHSPGSSGKSPAVSRAQQQAEIYGGKPCTKQFVAQNKREEFGSAGAQGSWCRKSSSNYHSQLRSPHTKGLPGRAPDP